MYKLGVYIPEENLEEVKKALFLAGAGHSENYDSCCWQTLGETQFRPLIDSQPAKGEEGKLIRVREYRLEMICEGHTVADVIQALKRTHPYEHPAWDLVHLVDESEVT